LLPFSAEAQTPYSHVHNQIRFVRRLPTQQMRPVGAPIEWRASATIHTAEKISNFALDACATTLFS